MLMHDLNVQDWFVQGASARVLCAVPHFYIEQRCHRRPLPFPYTSLRRYLDYSGWWYGFYFFIFFLSVAHHSPEGTRKLLREKVRSQPET